MAPLSYASNIPLYLEEKAYVLLKKMKSHFMLFDLLYI